MARLFDPALRALRRDRAARSGPALFLLERAFDECLERVAIIGRRFGDALLLGCPDPSWPGRLAVFADTVETVEPGILFASAATARCAHEEAMELEPASLDLICAVGTLDTVDDVPGVFRALGQALRPGGLLIGAMSGGDTLPRLRSAMLAAGRAEGGAGAHIHPRVESAALAPLLERAGLDRCVVDVDRVRVSYPDFAALVADLRAMGATNVLVERPRRTLSKAALAAARADFEAALGEKTVETFEILHFAAWKPERGTGTALR